MVETNSGGKPSPREILAEKELVGFETKTENPPGSAVKSGMTKSGKSTPGKAFQPSWAQG